MQNGYASHARELLDRIRADGFYKSERVIGSPQAAAIRLAEGKRGAELLRQQLSRPRRRSAARRRGEGGARRATASAWRRCASSAARRACTSNSKRALARVPAYRRHDPVLELLRRERRPVRDAARRGRRRHQRRAEPREHRRRHSAVQGASAIRYRNNDMADLEARLKEADAAGARFKLIATDGVFSMDGIVADLRSICDLAERHGALVMVDDSHAVGFVGDGGRGTPELCGVEGRIDIITGTLGKALGGASGGYTSGRREIVELLRQRSRPYLFSNSLAPVHRGGVARSARAAGKARRRGAAPARAANGERFRRGDGRRWASTSCRAGIRSSRSCWATRRSRRGWPMRCSPRHLRDRLFISRRAEGQGAHPHANERGAHRRADRPGGRRVRRSRQGARRHSIDTTETDTR